MKKLVLLLPFLLLACNEKKADSKPANQMTAEEFAKENPNMKTICRNGALYEKVSWSDGSFLIHKNGIFVSCKK